MDVAILSIIDLEADAWPRKQLLGIYRIMLMRGFLHVGILLWSHQLHTFLPAVEVAFHDDDRLCAVRTPDGPVAVSR
jgi:hypothetical protein